MHSLHFIATQTSQLFRRPRIYIWSIRVLQLVLIAISGLTAFLLRFEFAVPPALLAAMWIDVLLAVAVKVPVFHFFGMGRGVWRFFSTPDLRSVVCGNVVGSSLLAVAVACSPMPFPRSVLILDFLLCLALLTGVRAGTRLILEAGASKGRSGQPITFIYGAGRAGAMLLREGRGNRAFPNHICGFIDDNPVKHGMLINGTPVLGCGADMVQLAGLHHATEVLIAIPSAQGRQMATILAHCQAARLKVRTVPAIAQIIAGSELVPQIRDVAVEDILGRSAVTLDHSRISGKLRGRVALVTGAAGSIGSELCRQIARFEPSALVAFEVAESPLFELEQEMIRAFPGVAFIPEIGSIQNIQRLREVFTRHQPTVVYHAAAYKHVPMMEAHVFEAVENNVIGTFNVATISADCGVEDFVMISSDKAVRPTSMMGATKRVSEIVIRSLQNGGPRFVSVRFGNVLGSNGSVVPIFKKQIAAGGPVTVTHPDMKRYFMTIPEAAQLVLQASTMGKGGEIFVLDMGQPVKIADLARHLIQLSGLRPDHDVHIEYTGVRPGEKLYEELRIDSETAVPTYHQKIHIFAGGSLTADHAMRHLAAIRGACARRDLAALILELKDMVPDYNPSRTLLEGIVAPSLLNLSAAVNAESRNQAPVMVSAAAHVIP